MQVIDIRIDNKKSTVLNNCMEKKTQRILQDLYQRNATSPFITMNDFEIELGISGNEIRPLLEDLKEMGLIVEHEEGFQITDNGVNYCQSRWI